MELDPTTQLLLHHSGHIKLTDIEILKRSKYSSCSYSSGPNSILIRESIFFCDPVIVSGELDLPDVAQEFNFVRLMVNKFFDYIRKAYTEQELYGEFNHIQDISLLIREIAVDLFDTKYLKIILIKIYYEN